MTTSQYLRYTALTILFFGTLIAILLSMAGCMSVSPHIDPRTFCTMEHVEADGMHCTFNEAAYEQARQEREHLRTRQRWYAVGCDLITTVACLATGRGHELGGNATLLLKVPASIWAQKRLNAEDEAGRHVPYRIVTSAHIAACVSNIITCKLL